MNHKEKMQILERIANRDKFSKEEIEHIIKNENINIPQNAIDEGYAYSYPLFAIDNMEQAVAAYETKYGRWREVAEIFFDEEIQKNYSNHTIKNGEVKDKISFQLTKKDIFTINLKVNYHNIIVNYKYSHLENPFLITVTTTAEVYADGISHFGQCQETFIKKYPLFKAFYEKWNKCHLKGIDNNQLSELKNDIDTLQLQYEQYIETKKRNQ